VRWINKVRATVRSRLKPAAGRIVVDLAASNEMNESRREGDALRRSGTCATLPGTFEGAVSD